VEAVPLIAQPLQEVALRVSRIEARQPHHAATRTRLDVLAYVLPDGVVRYEPPLEPPGEPDTGTVTTS
jgi:hypothetical protein